MPVEVSDAVVRPVARPGCAEPVLPLRVSAIEQVAPLVRVIILETVDGAALPPWAPGAHVDVTVADGLTAQYSLASDPEDRSAWRIAVLREQESRGTSEYIHAHLGVGDVVSVSHPRNHFELAPAPRYVFIAGGIGVTPILPMARAARRGGAEYSILYGGRSRGDMAFLTELQSHGERLTIWPEHELGYPDLTAILAEPRPDTLVYCCGPTGLLDAVEQHMTRWPAGSLHVERFKPRDSSDVPQDADVTFEVEFAMTGVTAQVPPGRSILEVAQDAGIDVFFSCREGTCGSCETPILEGEADHRDSVLNAAEQAAGECLMICVSRAKSARLVLDL